VCRRRRKNIEGNLKIFRQQSDLIGSDFVGDIPVLGKLVGSGITLFTIPWARIWATALSGITVTFKSRPVKLHAVNREP
jgi:hypothetical protein